MKIQLFNYQKPRKYFKYLILANLINLISFQPSIAQNNNQSLADLLSGCYPSGYTYECSNEQTPLYDSLMRNESAGLSREKQCFANLNTVEYKGTSIYNVHIYHAKCSYLSETYHSLTYGCIDEPEVYCELIYEVPKR